MLLVNGAWQPKLGMQAGVWQRWRLVHTGYKRFLDLQIVDQVGREVGCGWAGAACGAPRPGAACHTPHHRCLPQAMHASTQTVEHASRAPCCGSHLQAGELVPDCELMLIAHDGIYVRQLPRPVPHIFLAAGSRGELFVRCARPGRYTLTAGRKPSPFGPGFGSLSWFVQPVVLTLEVAPARPPRTLIETWVSRCLVDLSFLLLLKENSMRPFVAGGAGGGVPAPLPAPPPRSFKGRPAPAQPPGSLHASLPPLPPCPTERSCPRPSCPAAAPRSSPRTRPTSPTPRWSVPAPPASSSSRTSASPLATRWGCAGLR